MRSARLPILLVLLGLLVAVPSGIAATRYLISSVEQLKPSVRTALRGDGYFRARSPAGDEAVYVGLSSPTPPGSVRPARVSVAVPAGNYIASGGCVAELVTSSHSLEWGRAWGSLNTTGSTPSADALESVSPDASGLGSAVTVPNAGGAKDVGTGITLASGEATLSDSAGFSLPRGGRIFQVCTGVGTTDSYMDVPSAHVTATRVGSLHNQG
jgi:hypothetical protein